MTNFVFYASPSLTLICVPHTEASSYSLEAAAELTGVHPEMLQHYCRLGLFGAPSTGPEPVFDEKHLVVIRRIEHYRRVQRVNLAALPLICDLWDRVKRLELELKLRTVLQ